MRRTPEALLHKVFVQGFTLAQLATRRRGVGTATYRYRFRQALQRFVARPSSVRIPTGALVLLADGLWFEFDGQPWVLYLTAVKPCRARHAIFLNPVLLPGPECTARWTEVFAQLPPTLQPRIRALVIDNLRGMRQLAHRRGWRVQLCHFHLLLKLQAHRPPRRALRGGPVRTELFRLVRSALTLPPGPPLTATLGRLQRLSGTDCGTQRIRGMVRELLRALPHYRAYLLHAALGLPHTTNSMESMGRLIRELLRRSRAGSNPTSLLLWTTAFLRLRPRITCNGH